MTYHVVCHDCEFEEIKQTDKSAWAATKGHREETEHDVEYTEIN